MSTIKNQTDLSGMLGESLSVRKINGRVVIKNRPARKLPEPSAVQLEFKKKFRKALQYAKQQMSQPDVKLAYANGTNKKLRSAFSVALKDYLVAPEVGPIDTIDYHGATGDPIVVTATDDFMVTKVKIIVTDAAGAILEQGEANPDPQQNILWVYYATVANPTLTGTKIQAIAYDRPGNRTSLEKVL